MVIYLDAYFIVNFIMNYCIFDTQRKMLGQESKKVRCILVSALASICSVISIILVDGRNIFIIWAIMLSFCFVADYIIYGKNKLNSKFTRVATVIVAIYVSASLVGKVMARISTNSIWVVIGIIILIKAIVDVVYNYVIKKSITEEICKKEKIYREMTRKPIDIIISNNDRKLRTKAIIDTGNSLCEPYSGKPVAVISSELFQRMKDNNLLSNTILNKPQKLMIIPYSSVGTNEGILYGIYVDSILLDKNINSGEIIQIEKPILAIYKGKLSFKNKYEILLHPKMVKGVV